MCMTSGTEQPQSTQGSKLRCVGSAGEKHVLNVPGVAVVGNKRRLWLLQVSDSTVPAFPHQWADARGDVWCPQAHSREELSGLCQGSFRAHHTAQCSALWRHAGGQEASPPPQCPTA